MALIESNPEIMMGKPVIAGTRVTVENKLERLAAGESVDEIVAEHPRAITPVHIHPCVLTDTQVGGAPKQASQAEL